MKISSTAIFFLAANTILSLVMILSHLSVQQSGAFLTGDDVGKFKSLFCDIKQTTVIWRVGLQYNLGATDFLKS
jgi:hypothetical protein